jgi:hypothetical protein
MKRSHCICINDSSIINEIFYGIEKKAVEDIAQNYVFVLQEDKVLQDHTDDKILDLKVDIVPNKKKKRLPYNFDNFMALYHCLKNNDAIPYMGEDIK